MMLTDFQKYMDLERWSVINKFQKKYKSSKEKVDALKNMDNKDIYFLIYCSDNIYANIFYSKYLKKEDLHIIMLFSYNLIGDIYE